MIACAPACAISYRTPSIDLLFVGEREVLIYINSNGMDDDVDEY